jgi:signal transduction histidine kinase
MTWIDPGDLERSWHPAFHAPEYRELERRLADWHQYVPLGTLVQLTKPARSEEKSDLTARWLVRLRRGGLEVEEIGDGPPPGPMVPLPPEAIVIASHFGTTVPLTHWDETLFPGGGLAQLGMIVLRPRGAEPIGWLAYELASDLVQLQLRRVAIGSVLPRVEVASLLDIRVRVPSPEEKRRLSEVVREKHRNKAAFERAHSLLVSAKKGVKPFLLTAATFEGRLEQFEDYLLEQSIVDAQSGFFVEASTTDHSSDLFVVRPLRGARNDSAGRQRGQLHPQEDRHVNGDWRGWYWESSGAEKFTIFNALGAAAALPSHLLARMTARTAAAVATDLRAQILPGFDFFRQAIEVHQDDEWDEGAAKQLLASSWLSLQRSRPGAEEPQAVGALTGQGEDFADRLFDWLRYVFRPAVALKVHRQGEVAGAYVLFGPDQIDDPAGARAALSGYGERLTEVLSQPSDIIDDAARRESLRRLSWVMHQLNGPIGRATNAAEDLDAFLTSAPEIAARLVPNEEKAKARAAMRGEDVERFTFATRLGELTKAIGDIRRLTYQVRRLRRAQGDLQKGKCDLAELLRLKATECAVQVHGLRIDTESPPVFVLGNADILTEAFSEVLNNACRELKENEIAQPAITLRVWEEDGSAKVAIRDNAFPVDSQLISNPFDEDASTYAKQGRGSGLGLAIVRETFRAHGGSCQLLENRDENGARLAGVTFRASLPLFTLESSREEADA